MLTIEAILQGVLCGLALAISVGPVFFALLHTSIEKGVRAAIAFATGIMLSDLGYILIIFFGFSGFFSAPSHSTLTGIAGGIILTGFGLYSFFKKVADKKEPLEKTLQKSHTYAIIKGWLINTLNPSVLILWIGIAGMFTPGGEKGFFYNTAFVASTLLTIFFMDVLKAIVARKIAQQMKQHALLQWFSKLSGGVLLFFGLRLLYRSFFA